MVVLAYSKKIITGQLHCYVLHTKASLQSDPNCAGDYCDRHVDGFDELLPKLYLSLWKVIQEGSRLRPKV
jgi:hypothetical protein